ncbi:MAG: PIN domain-containing protein [Desulfuromonadales bacterium]
MIVLDTHAWLWWVSNPELLGQQATLAIEKAVKEKTVHVSSISAWEVAMLVQKRRLQLTMDVRDWVLRSEALPSFLSFPWIMHLQCRQRAWPANCTVILPTG